MVGNELHSLPFIWLLSDVVWVVIGYLTTRATKQAEDYNWEPLVHFAVLSNSARQPGLFSDGVSGMTIPKAASSFVGSADATALAFQWKGKSRQSKKRTFAKIRTRWNEPCGLSHQ
jgi:hypothetical protein